jgi:hypothetical protein
MGRSSKRVAAEPHLLDREVQDRNGAGPPGAEDSPHERRVVVERIGAVGEPINAHRDTALVDPPRQGLASAQI